AASACSTASRSMIGRIRSFFGATRLARASLTKLRGNERRGLLAEARTCADKVESRTAGTRELARSRPELAGLETRNRDRELCLELRAVGQREPRLDRLPRALEERVDHLDLLRAGAEARERVNEPLQAVILLDDLGR